MAVVPNLADEKGKKYVPIQNETGENSWTISGRNLKAKLAQSFGYWCFSHGAGLKRLSQLIRHARFIKMGSYKCFDQDEIKKTLLTSSPVL